MSTSFKDANTLILEHRQLPKANKYFGIEDVVPDNITTIIAIDSINRSVIKTTIEREKKGFVGSPVISSPLLKGITDNLLVPQITTTHGVVDRIMATMRFGNVSFSQVFTRHASDKHCESVFFGSEFLTTMAHRIQLTHNSRNTYVQSISTDIPTLRPLVVKEILTKGAFKIMSPTREIKYGLVRETTNQHVEKMKNSGMIVKRTTSFFNKERKEHIDYIVISALGSFRIFEGENTNFEKESKTGYVLLADPIKPIAKLA